MRRIAIISDLHANLEATQAVLADIKVKGISEIGCLGDLVDYGADPGPVIDLTREAAGFVLAGNHEYYIDHPEDRKSVGSDARKSNDWTHKKLWPWKRHYLGRLIPRIDDQLNGNSVTYAHASPRDALFEYTFPNSPDTLLDEMCQNAGSVVYVGHSHRPFIRKLPSGKLIVNVGSVGQPRDGDTRAAYCITDGTEAGTSIERVSYDIWATQYKIRKAGLPETNAYRLELGR